jgi:hypothetical protein
MFFATLNQDVTIALQFHAKKKEIERISAKLLQGSTREKISAVQHKLKQASILS